MSTGKAEGCRKVLLAEPWVPLRVVLGHRLLLRPPAPRWLRLVPKRQSWATQKHPGAISAFYEFQWEATAAGCCSLTQFQSPGEGWAMIKGQLVGESG